MIAILRDNPLLLLFLVAAIGYPLGRLKFKGCSLGISAVLFVGLGIGAIHPDLKLPELLYLLGLTLFVYSIGLSSGPTFFASFGKRGLNETLFVFGVIGTAAASAVALREFLQLDSPTAAGIFAGSLNNTPALATVLDQLKNGGMETLLSKPVVGYSLTYPFGVLGPLLAIYWFQKIWKIDYAREVAELAGSPDFGERIRHSSIIVSQPAVVGKTLNELVRENQWKVVFGRVKSGGVEKLAEGDTVLQHGDGLVVVGTKYEIRRMTEVLGMLDHNDFSTDRSHYDQWRMFVSNPKVIGRKIGNLEFLRKFDARITRIRRGDVDLLAHQEMMLEPGDVIRVVTRPENRKEVARFFGDSYKAVSEIDVLSFSLGLTLGILLGLIPIPLFGVTVKLGFAGGPLVMGLILGRLNHTGPVVWVLPFGATIILRQIGLIMFLAGVGTRAGYAFFNTLLHGDGLVILAAGLVVTTVTVMLALWIGYRMLKIPMGRLVGILAGIQTQPAVLGFALEQTRNELPNAGYAMTHPVATIAKILLAQLVLTFG